MTAEAQRSFGPYQIKSSLGRGGMGEVFLAEDPRLRRRVAVKILAAAQASETGRRARFFNEARAVSALHHPHIVTIFDVGTENGVDYLVMEYVDGRTLRDLMAGRGVDLRRILEIAAQVASGLAAAHAAGIVHRDIKPENIMVSRDGSAKILDYGVAKLTEDLPHDGNDDSATAVAQLTTPGALVGTIAYMSPEQIEAKPVDHRSDIFSLGTVLLEMLSGRNPFAGASTTDTLHKILNAPPSFSEIRDLSPRVNDILSKALARDPADRYQHAGDLQLDLRRALTATDSTERPQPPSRRPLLVPALIAAIILVSAAAVVTDRHIGRSTVAPRVSFAPLTRDPGYEGEPTFSPDGQTMAYVSDRTGNLEIFLKQISGGPDLNLTNNIADDVQPAFSADAKQIAFVSTRQSSMQLVFRNPTISEMGGDIWVMPALGGAPRRVAENGNFPAWSPDGSSIIFTRGPWMGQRIYRVASTGGEATALPITTPVQHLFMTHATFSPDGRWIAFDSQQPDNIYVVPSHGGRAVPAGHGSHPAWMPDSRTIVYSDSDPGRNSTLSRVRITDDGREAAPPEPLTSGRGEDKAPAISRDGKSIVFAAQTVAFNIERVRFDGDRGAVIGPPEAITRGSEVNPFFSVSPDGRSIAFQAQHGIGSSIWRKDLDTGAVTQLTNDQYNDAQPDWSPDGRQIAFTRDDGSKRQIWVMSSDGGNPHFTIPSGGFVSWTPDGRTISYYDYDHRDVRLFDLASKRTRVLATEGTVRTIQRFSHDGRWMLYQALGENGLTQVRVVPFDSTRSRILVSNWSENFHPFFSADGKWVYYEPNHKNLFRIPGPAQNWKSAPPQQVTFFPESNLYLEQPQMSADGNYLYFSRRSVSSDLWIARLEH